MAALPPPVDDRSLRTIRRLILCLLMVGVVGTFAELLLLGHDEEPSQAIPLVLLAGAAVAVVWAAWRPSRLAVTVFRVVMVVLIGSAVVGLVLHFQANIEFQRDLTPDAPVGTLFWKVMAAKAPPALAPAVLAQLGCLGLIYAYRLPMNRR